jgi:hypothetical protein
MPAAPELIETDPSNILLAVDVPESACPGSTFHVELKNRFFEVIKSWHSDLVSVSITVDSIL